MYVYMYVYVHVRTISGSSTFDVPTDYVVRMYVRTYLNTHSLAKALETIKL